MKICRYLQLHLLFSIIIVVVVVVFVFLHLVIFSFCSTTFSERKVVTSFLGHSSVRYVNSPEETSFFEISCGEFIGSINFRKKSNEF